MAQMLSNTAQAAIVLLPKRNKPEILARPHRPLLPAFMVANIQEASEMHQHSISALQQSTLANDLLF